MHLLSELVMEAFDVAVAARAERMQEPRPRADDPVRVDVGLQLVGRPAVEVLDVEREASDGFADVPPPRTVPLDLPTHLASASDEAIHIGADEVEVADVGVESFSGELREPQRAQLASDVRDAKLDAILRQTPQNP